MQPLLRLTNDSCFYTPFYENSNNGDDDDNRYEC